MASDLTTEILVQIRDEIRKTNERLDATRTEVSFRIDATNDRLDRLDKRQAESEIRLSTELIAVAGAIREVRDLLREDRATREAVQRHETRFVDVEQRLAAVERKVG